MSRALRHAARLEELRGLLVEELGLSVHPAVVQPDTPLLVTGLALESIDVLELARLVEERWAVQLPEGADGGLVLRTVGTLLAFIDRSLQPASPEAVRAALEEATLLREAGCALGGAAAPDEEALRGLRLLTEALAEEAGLTGRALQAARTRLLWALRRRAQLQPPVDAAPLEAPLFIIGLPRSGTTLLQRLLSRLSALDSLSLRELVGPSGQEAVALLEQSRRLTPGLRAVHPMDPAEPDECSWLFECQFRTPVWAAAWHVPRYAEALLDGRLTPCYRDYRRRLQALRPTADGRRLLLKDPFHSAYLLELLAVFPDARLIVLKRPAAEVEASFGRLCAALQSTRTSEQGPAGAAARARSRRVLLARLRARLAADQGGLPARALLELDYADLVADPIATVERVAHTFGLPLDEADRRRLRALLAVQ